MAFFSRRFFTAVFSPPLVRETGATEKTARVFTMFRKTGEPLMNQPNSFLPGGVLGIALLASVPSGAAAQTSPPPPRIPEAVIETITPAVSRDTAQGAMQMLAGGTWVNKGYDIHGRWKIVARDGSRYIEFDRDFKTRRGPDLKVYLSSRPLEALTDRTVAPNSVEIAPLKAPRGAQEYEIPAHINLSEYRSLVIHCKRFSHLWGGGAISP